MNKPSARDIYDLLHQYRSDLINPIMIEELFFADMYLTNKGSSDLLTIGSMDRSYLFDKSGQIKWKKCRIGIIENPSQFLTNLKAIIKDIEKKNPKKKVVNLIKDLKALCSLELEKEVEPYISPESRTIYDLCANLVFVLFMIAIDPDKQVIDFCLTEQEKAKLVRTSRWPRREEKNDIPQTILENSKNMFRKVDEDYKPNPDLCPELSGEIKKHTLIVSDGGAGKTTWMYKKWGELLEKYKTNPNNAQIPIYIELNAFDGSNTNNPTTGSFVKSRIAQQYAGLRQEDVSTLLKQMIPDQYVLLLDGMNEAKNSDALSSEIKELKDAGFHIILTSRRELNREIWEDFSVVTLERFSEEKINQILRDRGFPEAAGRLLTTLDRPMFLALYLGLGNDAKGLQLPGELFLAHHKWIKKMFSVDKHGPAYHKQGDRLLGNALPKLATQTNAIVFSGSDVAEIFEDKTVRCDPDEALPILCETGIIIDEGYDEYEGTHVYRWKHEFFLQFYQAMRIWQQMGYSTDKRTFQAIKTLPQELFQKDIDDHVLAFLGDILESQFEGKASITSPMSPIEKWLQDNCRVQSIASKQYTDNEIQMCTANLIRTMILARDGLLEYTIFDGLDLQKVEFYDCWLTGSCFSKCRNINKDNFYAAGHECPPNSFAASAKRNLLFSSSEDETCVLVWDLSTNKVITRINCVDKVAAIAMSPDEKWLAVQHLPTRAIEVFNLNDMMAGAEHSPKIFKLGTDAVILKPQKIFFDSQSEILFCLLSEKAFCLRWDIATETEIEGFSVGAEIKDQRKQVYLYEEKHCACSITDRLFILRHYDIGVYNIRTGKEERTIRPPTTIRNICVTPNGERLVALDVANGSSAIYVYGLVDGIDDYTISSPDIKPLLTISATDTFICGVQMRQIEGETPELDRMEYNLLIWEFSSSEESIPSLIKDVKLCHAYAAPNTDTIFFTSLATHIHVINLLTYKQAVLFGHGTSYYSTNVYFTDIEDVLLRRYENGDVFLLNLSKKTSTRVPNLSKFLHSDQAKKWDYKFNGRFLFIERILEDVVVWDVLNDEYKDTIPGSLTNIAITGKDNDVIINQNSELGYSAWKMPGHHLLGQIDGDKMWAKSLLLNSAEADFSLDNWLAQRLSAHSVMPALFAVATGYPDGSVAVWNILSGQNYEVKISCFPIKQVHTVPNTSCICIVSGNGMITLFDVNEKSVVCEWDASDNLRTLTGHTLVEDEARMDRFCIQPITEDISVVDYNLGPGEQGCFFVRHFANGIRVGDNIPSFGPTIIASKNGKTLLKPLWMTFVVYDVPHLVWDERNSIPQNPHYDISPDGTKLLRASENGDIVVYGVQDQTKFVWTKSDSIDLSGCDFRNTPNLDDNLKTFLQMNDAII